jgi:hypothetical protein
MFTMYGAAVLLSRDSSYSSTFHIPTTTCSYTEFLDSRFQVQLPRHNDTRSIPRAIMTCFLCATLGTTLQHNSRA